MRNTLIGLVFLASGSCALAPSLSAQQLPNVPIPVPKAVRIDLVNSVLKERQRIFRQPVRINGCRLSEAIGVLGEDLRPQVDSAFRDRVHGKPGACTMGRLAVADSNFATLTFDSFYPEHTEYVAIVDPQLGHRPGGMIVVRIRVARWGQESHIEEWVMIQADLSVWRTMTVRISQIGAA